MISVEAGPYELVRDEQNADQPNEIKYDKVTLCLMSDNSVSERHYSKYGGLTQQKVHAAKSNIDDALSYLGQLTDKYKAENYNEHGDAFKPPKSKAVAQLQMLGKRKAEQ